MRVIGMRVIVVPNGTGSRPHKCLNLTPWMVVAASVVALVVVLLPGLIGYGAYRIGAAAHKPDTAEAAANGPPAIAESFRLSLAREQSNIEQAKQRMEYHLDAMGQRLGKLQAQFSRLNALGQRLAAMAGVDESEFGFSDEPAIGGPELSTTLARTAERDLMKILSEWEAALRNKEEELEILEGLMADRTLHKKQFPHGWPVENGWISSSFGYRNDPFTGRRAFHNGVDIASKTGAPIRSVAAGVVTHAGVKAGYGIMVEINHGNGYVTRYAHALSKTVAIGERVEKGQVVAVVGSTGRSTGAHLHFEVLRQGRNVNPRRYIRTAAAK